MARSRRVKGARGPEPHPDRDEIVARVLRGESSVKDEAARIRRSYKTVGKWVHEQRRVDERLRATVEPRDGRPALERALAAAGEHGRPEGAADAAPNGSGEPAPGGELPPHPDVKLTPEALVSLSELCVTIPVGVFGSQAGLPAELLERHARFTASERATLLGLAPAAIPELESLTSKWKFAGVAIYGLALGFTAWAHLAAVRKIAAALDARQPRTHESTAGAPRMPPPPPTITREPA